MTTMKPLICKYLPILAGSLMSLMLAGCQQNPPPVVVNPQPGTSSTTERTTTTNTETKQDVPNPDGSVQTYGQSSKTRQELRTGGKARIARQNLSSFCVYTV